MDISVLVFDRPLSLGQQVRLQRIARGWRQWDLGFTAGVSPFDVSALERNLRVSQRVKLRVLDALGMDSHDG